MAELNSPGSRVVLVGTQACANDAAAPPVPAVESTMEDLAHVLRNRCGVRSEQIIRILDSADPMRMGLAVAEAADQATDVLLVHYVGHGFVSADGELYLATKATDPNANRLEHSSVPFTTIRRSLLKSRARAIVVVLDCCFSGRAIGTLSAQDPIDLADVHGGYILTSAARDQVALAPPGAQHTAFTGELIRLLDRGDPSGPAELSMRDVYRGLDRELHRRGLPRPRQRGSERIDDLVIAPNAARISAPALLPATPEERVVIRRRKRLLLALAATTAALVAAVATPVLWSGSESDPQARPAPAPAPSLSSPVPAKPPGAETPAPTENATSSPVPCGERTDDAGCELPAHSTARAAAGSLVTLQRAGADVRRYRQRPDGSWAGPENIGGGIGGDPVIVPDANGRLVAFAAGKDGGLRYNLSAGGAVRSTKSAWRTMEGVDEVKGRPTAHQDSDGNLEVFVRGDSDKLWQLTQLEPGKDLWSDAVPMRGAGDGVPSISGDPKVHIDQHGYLRVFALDLETKRLRTWAQRGSAKDQWEEHPDHPFGDKPLAAPPTVALGGDGLLHLFALDELGLLWQVSELPGAPNVWPGAWEVVPALKGVHTGQPMSATNGAGEVLVFVRVKDPADRVVYASLGRPEDSVVELDQPMNVLWSVTPDEDDRLVVQGVHNDVVVTGSP
ncbi:caspase family protein [Saccharopolyspora sp. NFXS83]|uniref:caspase, EACC1-associated type n=1 Tax=Saccharopolyspora sp. NFXS83 TaxID=2993560 RepID=UPI00224B9BE1|nr:caspase family protein [Saccharopolyspora sp. NFXS83]MCX2730151.1 caspase family protein [Saccharopolyspora sp. NFXS83]